MESDGGSVGGVLERRREVIKLPSTAKSIIKDCERVPNGAEKTTRILMRGMESIVRPVIGQELASRALPFGEGLPVFGGAHGTTDVARDIGDLLSRIDGIGDWDSQTRTIIPRMR